MSGYYYKGVDIATIINNSSTQNSPATSNNFKSNNFKGTGNATGIYINNTNYTAVQTNVLSPYFNQTEQETTFNNSNFDWVYTDYTYSIWNNAEAYSVQCTNTTNIPIPSGCNSIYFYAISGGGGGGGASGGYTNHWGGAGGNGANGIYLYGNYPITSGSINFTFPTSKGTGGTGGNSNADNGGGLSGTIGQGIVVAFPNITCTANGGGAGVGGGSAGYNNDGAWGPNSNIPGSISYTAPAPSNFFTTTTFTGNSSLIYNNTDWKVQPLTNGYNTPYGYGLGGLGGERKTGYHIASYGPNSGNNRGYPGFNGGDAFAQVFFFYN